MFSIYFLWEAGFQIKGSKLAVGVAGEWLELYDKKQTQAEFLHLKLIIHQTFKCKLMIR